MPGTPVRLGPFTGGLNTLSDPTALDDSELVDCVNLELDLDGSLLSRSPIALKIAGPAGATLVCLGYAIFSSGNYMICSCADKTYYYYNGSFTLITDSFAATDFVQYRSPTGSRIWLVHPSGTGGSWDPTNGYTSVPGIPAGNKAIVNNQIMFVIPGIGLGSKVMYSNPDDFTTWNSSSNFITINDGDGQDVIDAAVFNGNIFFFKQKSTYAAQYDLIPNTASIRQISATIGVSDINCLVQYEQALYIYHEANVYEITNFDFTRINTKVPFDYDPTTSSSYTNPAFLTIFGDRLLVRYFNRVYVYGMRTRTWTRWESSIYFGPLVSVPNTVISVQSTIYYMGSCVNGDYNLYTIEDGFSTSNSEQMMAYVKTKNYDLSVSHHFKRLFWWGADISAATAVTGKVTPIVITFSVTWNDLSTKRWNELGTWDQPLNAPLTTITNVIKASKLSRKFIKFLKGIRFREVSFELSIPCTGVTSDSPVRVFNITALVQTKETVVASIS